MRIEQNTTSFEIDGTRSLIGRLQAALGSVKRLWVGHAASRQLNEMADWELDDIGLTRDDIRSLRDLSPFNDPTRVLNQLVREREREIRRRKA